MLPLFQDSKKDLNTLLAKTKQIELVGQILHNKLADIIPHGSESVSIKILLEWDTWPLFISIHSKFICNCSFLKTFFPFQYLWLQCTTITVRLEFI